jgi:hypothetical protein
MLSPERRLYHLGTGGEAVKMTIVTRKDGRIIGAVYGHALEPDGAERPGGDQELHVLDVPDEVLRAQTATELHDRLEAHFRRTVKKPAKKSRRPRVG